MWTTYQLTIASIKMFVRNRQALFFTLFTPLIIMLIFGFIGFDRVSKINVGVVSPDPSPQTQQFIDQIKAVPAFSVTSGSSDDEAAALERGDRSLVLAIPSAAIPADPAQLPQTITAFTNTGQEQQAQTAISIINQIIDRLSLALHGTANVVLVATRDVNVNNLKYIDFLLPGLVALAVMQMAVFSVAFVFADYKEKGILKRVLATPVKPYQFVTANIVTRLIISVIQASILIAVGVFMLHAHVIGSFWLVLLVVLLGAIMFLGLGFTISGLASTVETVPALANLVVFPMLFLGGTFFPLSSMPQWLQRIAQYLPLTYFSSALREVMTRNAGFSGIKADVWWMLGWAVVLVILANITFSFEERRS